MPKLFIRHAVRDYATWRAAYDAHEPARAAAGLSGGQVYRSTGSANDVLVVLEAASVEQARAFGGDPAVRQAMAAGGVIGEPVVDVVA